MTVSGHQRQTATGKTILGALSIRLQDRAALRRRPNPRTLVAPLNSSLSEQRFPRPLHYVLVVYLYLRVKILERIVGKSLTLKVNLAERGGFEPPLGCLFPKTF